MPEPQEQTSSTDERRLSARERRIRRQQAQADADLREVLATRAGRAVLFQILRDGRVYEQSFNPDSTHLTAFNEGRRSVGNQLLARIELAASEKLAIMRDEARKDLQEEQDA